MSLINKILQETIGDAQRIVQWPDSFVHAKSGAIYKPHNETEYKFVYEDSPRFSLILGGEGCIAAETEINGVPAAEWKGGSVATLYGNLPSTQAYSKGFADLYRVRTKLGWGE